MEQLENAMNQETREIEFINVGKTFLQQEETLQVLKGINGKVEKGSILTLIGPSGSGKSTLISLCNLLQTPDEGKIYIGDREIRQWDIQELRRRVGIAFQAAPMMRGTALENLALPAALKGETLKDPEKYMNYVGLSTELLSREARELSGGQRQRLSFARTLVNKPAILLLDEVTSALDSISAHEIEELILRINKERNVTVLWVTHDLSQAERVGDQTWLLMDGVVIEAAPTERFFSEPTHELTKEFIETKKVHI